MKQLAKLRNAIKMENQVYRRKGICVTTLQLTTLAHLVGYSLHLGLPTRNRFRRYQNGFWLCGGCLDWRNWTIPAMILWRCHDILKFALGGAKGVYFPGYT